MALDLPPAGIIGGLVALGLMSLVIWSANRRKPGAAPRTAALYGPGMVAIATLMVLVYLAIMIVFILSVLAENPTATEWVFLGLGVFGLLLVAAVYDVFTRRIDWSGEGLVFRSWRGEAECLWADIDAVDYKPIMQYWRVSFRGRRRGFALFEYMAGARDFLEEAQRKGVPITLWGNQTVP
jgi:hypothetical protein